MTKRLRVIAIVIGLLAMCGGTVSAYSEDSSLNVTIIEGTDEFTATLDEPVSVEELLELQARTCRRTLHRCRSVLFDIQGGDAWLS